MECTEGDILPVTIGYNYHVSHLYSICQLRGLFSHALPHLILLTMPEGRQLLIPSFPGQIFIVVIKTGTALPWCRLYSRPARYCFPLFPAGLGVQTREKTHVPPLTSARSENWNPDLSTFPRDFLASAGRVSEEA